MTSRMNSTRSLVIALAFVGVFSLMSLTASARGPLYDDSPYTPMTTKLGRGLLNVGFCWVEIPKCIYLEWINLDPVTGTAVGAVEGLGLGAKRLLLGVYEVVTFPVPTKRAYQPLMEPEFVMQDLLD